MQVTTRGKISFNRFYIIESLIPGEEKTGQKLYNEVFQSLLKDEKILTAEYISLYDRQEFHIALTDIWTSAKNNEVWPFIHFEIHGRTDGLRLGNGDIILWKDLYYQLVRINTVTKNNLFISLATCFGAHIIKCFDATKRAPFACYIGPIDEMYNDVLYMNFHDFFTVLIQTHNVNKAVDALNLFNTEILYAGDTAENLFRQWFSAWISRYEDPAFLEERINEHVKTVTKEKPYADPLLIRVHAEHLYKGQKEFARKAIDYFLFKTDDYPLI